MNYKQIYINHFGFIDWIPCEVCYQTAVHVHHIKFRSQQGSDNIENLMALCHSCHDSAHFKKEPYLHKEQLQEIHNLFLITKQI
jgi:5-methylcytosine-specific restriction endonuclease McrA